MSKAGSAEAMSSRGIGDVSTAFEAWAGDDGEAFACAAPRVAAHKAARAAQGWERLGSFATFQEASAAIDRKYEFDASKMRFYSEL